MFDVCHCQVACIYPALQGREVPLVGCMFAHHSTSGAQTSVFAYHGTGGGAVFTNFFRVCKQLSRSCIMGFPPPPVMSSHHSVSI